MIRSLCFLLQAVPAISQTAAPFEVEEATIAQVHDAMKAGRLTCRALVDQYLKRIDAYDKNGPAINAIVLINPEVELLTEERVLRWEGCLSIPGLRAAVPRAPRIRYSGVDCDGNPVERVVSGFHAGVVQHEYDHLDGILYPMRMRDFALFGFTEELSRAAQAAAEAQQAAR